MSAVHNHLVELHMLLAPIANAAGSRRSLQLVPGWALCDGPARRAEVVAALLTVHDHLTGRDLPTTTVALALLGGPWLEGVTTGAARQWPAH
eukprot:CAMPEP_0171067924 /NCGR_PEP_ID=MMETSP0766_2-20121228/8271_1 /TAXON_ID=439317 /ORGANISM="Gambierdiscus australes, Strain CAWD 149" /LENGTH=91 /DNA_ID=CAMNT_0011524193 /DNA_START=157 /DNA_END=429 /DNA_ORIENTATION=-